MRHQLHGVHPLSEAYMHISGKCQTVIWTPGLLSLFKGAGSGHQLIWLTRSPSLVVSAPQYTGATGAGTGPDYRLPDGNR
jgi:hypothetical protein